jgi:predicted patatin/cPLA2 family phospholipase
MYLDLDYIYSTLSNSDGEDPLDYEAFSKTEAKYYVAATNARTGRPHYFSNSDVVKDDYRILKASSALPLACRPVRVGGEYYFDGGVAEPVPYRKAFGDGCDRLVVVLTRPRDQVRAIQSNMAVLRMFLRKYPEIIKDIEKRHIKYNDAVADLKRMEADGKALIVAPKDIAGMKTLTKDRQAIEKLYGYGYEDGKKIAAYIGHGG